MNMDNELIESMVSRHTPGVYEKVSNIKVGIAGAGGIGSNVAVSLSRLGIGEITVVDFDTVEASNLNRQQYFIEDIGKYKVNALKDIIKRINPFIRVNAIVAKIDSENVNDYFKDVDIIIEAFDGAENKAMISNYVLTKMRDKYLVASSGMAGYSSSNIITTKKIRDKFYLCGDFVNEVNDESGVMAPRVLICANHMANMVLRIIMGQKEIE
ncbi:MAG: sulfur carrier protein ThiS adenylyltransferase ThiF [Clostridium sp.]|uniref:sulfur carrier protein ThiS adenylyltransferase ThiF n=1 Tax=Clostridium sp. TaxID=1506 RepID=UPI003055957D